MKNYLVLAVLLTTGFLIAMDHEQNNYTPHAPHKALNQKKREYNQRRKKEDRAKNKNQKRAGSQKTTVAKKKR